LNTARDEVVEVTGYENGSIRGPRRPGMLRCGDRRSRPPDFAVERRAFRENDEEAPRYFSEVEEEQSA
jgi:hypothetical protein